jgi:hypothetical protein
MMSKRAKKLTESQKLLAKIEKHLGPEMTDQEMGDRIGASVHTVRAVRYGRRHFRIDQACMAALMLGLDAANIAIKAIAFEARSKGNTVLADALTRKTRDGAKQ